MINGMTDEEFIKDPDTVDFVVLKNTFFEYYVANHPEILMTQLLQGQYWVGYTSRGNFPKLLTELGSSFIDAPSMGLGLLGRQDLEQAGISQTQQHPYLELRGNGVLIGFVDTGIDYTKDIFIYEDGTSKIQYIYDQTAEGTPPEGFFLGVEYNNQQINTALHSDDPYSVVPQRDTVGHGTFLASIAAGRETDDFIGAAPDAELIIVKLKTLRSFYREIESIPPDQKDVFGSTAVMVGVEYILKKANELNKPVAICIGVGTNLGSHDGFTLFEQYLEGISRLRGICICTSAGNESNTRHHTKGILSSTDEMQNVDIIFPENAYSTLVNIWNSATDRISVSIRSPTGELINRIPARNMSRSEFRLLLEDTTVVVEYFFPVPGSGSQLTIIRFIHPTPGIWTVTVHGDIVLDGSYHAWLPITGLVTPGIEFLTANPYTTIVVPSTMFAAITSGAYEPDKNVLYTETSWGPTRLPIMSPHLVAPGVGVTGIYPDGPGTMTGTSAAAAITSGASALMLQWGVVNGNDPAMSTYQIRAFLLRGCNRSDAMDYPNFKWGYGSLNLMHSFNLMREQR